MLGFIKTYWRKINLFSANEQNNDNIVFFEVESAIGFIYNLGLQIQITEDAVLPSTTFRPKDTFSIISNEYQDLKNTFGVDGVCIDDDPLNGFVIWWVNENLNLGICLYVWVAEKFRGKSYGTMLLNEMVTRIKSQGIETCRSFVSATNIASIKSHLKSNYELSYISLNYNPINFRKK